MTLGYRALFNLPPGRGPINTAREQMHAWLRSKQYQADSLADGREVSVGAGVSATAVLRVEQDSSTAWRCRVVENQSTGTWTTTLTAYETPGGDPDWLLLELGSPDGWTDWIGTHRIARYLLGSTEVYDGNGRLSPAPVRLAASEVGDLMRVLGDPRRRGLVYVTGTDASLPTEKWFGYARDLLKDTAGVAAAYLLDAEATDAFTALAGDDHAVGGGTIRTFFPGPDFTDPTDARRHLILSTRTIVGRHRTRLSRNLGWRSRGVVLAHPLPSALRRMAERLVSDEDAVALQIESAIAEEGRDLPPAEARSGAHTAAPAPRATPTVRTAPVPSQFHIVTEKASVPAGALEWRDVGRPLLVRLLGLADPGPEDLRQVEVLANTGREHQAKHDEAIGRLRDSRTETSQLRQALAEAQTRLDDEQLEHQIDAEELRTLVWRNRQLEGLLVQSGFAAQVYGGPPEPESPRSFEDVCIQMDDLENLVFTGDGELTVELDSHNPLGRWAAKTWDFLLELNDYAQAKVSGTHTGDVHHFLTASTVNRVATTLHARTESETVQNNAKWRGARVFPVPESVDPRGEIEMLAHFKIAKFGMISPRLHYHDATGRDGRIYVGYIGPHLPSNLTN